jgi:hypothetical protein
LPPEVLKLGEENYGLLRRYEMKQVPEYCSAGVHVSQTVGLIKSAVR